MTRIASAYADVRELRCVDQVADRVDAGLAGAAVLVDDDEAALVDDHGGAVEAELVGEGSAADRHDDDVDFDRLAVAVRHDRAAGVVRRVAIDHDAGLDRDLLLLERLLDDLRDVLVEAGQDLRQSLENGHLGTEIGERRRELAADRATTDDGDACRERVEIEHLVAGHDRPTTLEAGNQAGHRAGGEHDEVARDRGGATVAQGDVDRAPGPERTDAVEHLDLAALAHRRDSADQALHDALLAFLRRGECNGRHRHRSRYRNRQRDRRGA